MPADSQGMVCANSREPRIANKYLAAGYKALKKGWPDFLFYNDAGEIVLVEVKRKETRTTRKMGLSEHQSKMKELLSQHFKYLVVYVK